MHLAVDLPKRALDFGMAVMADEHQHATPGDVSPPLVVHLGDQRARGVDGRQRPHLGFLLDLSRDAVGAEDGHGARRHVLQRLDEAGAFRLERFDDMAIVNDLVAHVDRGAMLGQRPLDNIDRPNDAGAKPARLSKNDLHSLDLLAEASDAPDDRLAPNPRPRDEFRNPIHTRRAAPGQET